MKKNKFIIMILLLVFTSVNCMTVSSEAKTNKRDVIIEKIGKNYVYYRKATIVSKYLKSEDNYIIGYGKRKKLRINKKTKYYLFWSTLDESTAGSKKAFKNTRISKSVFKKNIWKLDRYKENGKVYYMGIICKLRLRGNKVISVKQAYQP